jgi:hypothetical protein
LAPQLDNIEKFKRDNLINIDLLDYLKKLEALKLERQSSEDKKALDLYLNTVNYSLIRAEVNRYSDLGNFNKVTELQTEFLRLSQLLKSSTSVVKVDPGELSNQLIDHLKIQTKQPTDSDLIIDLYFLQESLSKHGKPGFQPFKWSEDIDVVRNEEIAGASSPKASHGPSFNPHTKSSAGPIKEESVQQESKARHSCYKLGDPNAKGNGGRNGGVQGIFDEQRFYQHDNRQLHQSRGSIFAREEQSLRDGCCAKGDSMCWSTAQTPSQVRPGMVQYLNAAGKDEVYVVLGQKPCVKNRFL